MSMRLAVTLLCVLRLAGVAAADPVDDYVRGQLASRHLPGVSVAVIKDGVVLTHTAGLPDFDIGNI